MLDKLTEYLYHQESFVTFKNQYPQEYKATSLSWDQIAPEELRLYFNSFPDPKPLFRIKNGDYFICEFLGLYLVLNLWSFPMTFNPNLLEYEILISPEEVWEKHIKPDIQNYYDQK